MSAPRSVFVVVEDDSATRESWIVGVYVDRAATEAISDGYVRTVEEWPTDGSPQR